MTWNARFPGRERYPVLDTLRTTSAAVAAMLLARLLKLPEYYWAPISAIVVVQSNIPPTVVGLQRFLGTALGAVVAAALATFLPSNVLVYAVGVMISGLAAWLLRIEGARRFAAITVTIVLLPPTHSAPWLVALHRFLDVSVGIAVAIAVTTVWPLSREPA